MSGQTSDLPLSSRKTRVAPRLCHFFYPRPTVAFPIGNLGLIALQRQPLGFLATPVETMKQPPNSTPMIGEVELLSNQPSHSRQGPVFSRIPIGASATYQFLLQAFELTTTQTTRTSRQSPRRLLLALTPFSCLTPATQTPGRDPNQFCNFIRRPASFEQLESVFASLLQLQESADWSHGVYETISSKSGH